MCPYPYIKCAGRVMKKISYKFHQGALSIIMFVVIFAGITLTPTFSSFNPFPSLSSLAKDDRKPFQSLNIVLYNKTGSFFLEFS